MPTSPRHANRFPINLSARLSFLDLIQFVYFPLAFYANSMSWEDKEQDRVVLGCGKIFGGKGGVKCHGNCRGARIIEAYMYV